jgi:3-oxoacyl-[acyl-carrier protein] reductase
VATARGVEGFARSLGKELGRKGVTVNLAYVAPDAVDRLEGVLRFFCGTQTTYVSGQAVRVTATAAVTPHPRCLQCCTGGQGRAGDG